MDKDKYGEVINGIWTYTQIASDLITKGSCIIGWIDQECDHRDILFTYQPRQYGTLQRGLRWCYLYVSIMSLSCMVFLIESDGDNRKHKSYIKEKLNLSDNPCNDKICDLVNGVIEYIDKLEGRNNER